MFVTNFIGLSIYEIWISPGIRYKEILENVVCLTNRRNCVLQEYNECLIKNSGSCKAEEKENHQAKMIIDFNEANIGLLYKLNLFS